MAYQNKNQNSNPNNIQGQSPNQKDITIRLNKYLSEMGICSRREADRLIEDKKVSVDGQAASPGMKISPGQRIICDGKLVGSADGQKKSQSPSFWQSISLKASSAPHRKKTGP